MKKLLILLLVILTACSNATAVKRKTVAELAVLQKGSNADVFAYEDSSVYRDLVHLRESNEILRFGEIANFQLPILSQKMLSFTRMYNGMKLIVIHNLDQQPQNFVLTSVQTALYSHGGTTLTRSAIYLSAFSSIIPGE